MKKRKRTLAAALAFLIVLVMVLGIILPFVAPAITQASEQTSKQASESETEANNSSGISVECEMGFSGVYKVNCVTPFKAHLTNNSGKNFKGELQIKVNLFEEIPDAFNQMSMFNIYAYPVELPNGGSKVVEMEASLPTIRKSYDIELVDENNKVVATKKLTAKAFDPASVFVGVLTENISSVSYMRKFELNVYTMDGNTQLSERLIKLDENNFPTSEDALKNFNLLIINDFDTSRLSGLQKEALINWVKAGGNLFIGTGANYEKVFKGIDQQLVSASSSGIKTIDVPDFKAYQFIDIEEPTPVTIVDLFVEGGEPYFTEGETPLSLKFKNELGTVTVYAFDLGQDTIQTLNQAGSFLEKEYLELNKGQNNNYSYYMDYEYLVGNLPSLNNSTIVIIFVVIIIYAILIGPLLYILLKKVDMREKGFVIVPIIAIIVTFSIYLLSFGGMYKKPITNTLSLVTMEEDLSVANINSNIGVFSPSKGDLNIELSDNMPITISPYYRYYYGGSQQNDKNVVKLTYSEPPKLTYYGKAFWDSSFFSSDTTADLGGTLKANLTFDGKLLKGTIVNNTNLDLEDIIVGYNSLYTKYPKLAKGETLEVSQSTVPDLDSNQGYDKRSSIYQVFVDYSMPGDPFANMTIDERRDIQYKQNVMSNFVMNNSNYAQKVMYSSGGVTTISSSSSSSSGQLTAPNVYELNGSGGSSVEIYAFTSDKVIKGDILVNGNIPTSLNTSVIQLKTPVDLSGIKKFDLPYGVISVAKIVTDAQLDIMSGGQVYVMNGGLIEYNYNMLEGSVLESFRFEPFSVPVGTEIFNAKDQTWEGLKTAEYKENAMDYVSEEGVLKVRVDTKSDTHLSSMPRIAVKGTRE